MKNKKKTSVSEKPLYLQLFKLCINSYTSIFTCINKCIDTSLLSKTTV